MVSFHIRFPIHIRHPTLICKVFIKILHSSPKNKRLRTHCCKGHQAECSCSFYLPSDLPLSLCTNASLLNDQEEKVLRSHDFKQVLYVMCLGRGKQNKRKENECGTNIEIPIYFSSIIIHHSYKHNCPTELQNLPGFS